MARTRFCPRSSAEALPFLAQPQQQVDDLLAGGGVEVAGRFVGQQQRRLGDERASDRHPLLLAARELAGQGLLPAGEPDGRDEVTGPGLAVEAHPVRQHRREHVVEHAEGRQQVEALEDEPDRAPVPLQPAPPQRVDALPAHVDLAPVREVHGADEVQQRRFARPGRAGERHGAARRDVQADPVEGEPRRVRPGDRHESDLHTHGPYIVTM
ncbi:hypothetical protein Amac_096010 [Acrocarpospora macrocephala]|uniref:Uncharacterized protein n=1 Tax=Acrocarpospora macrocephala TaxID=150177 RepID=A0A5M3XAW0_9ACTN|nr:hypothetical protein [Acrocarpospora macrocephala]GES16003.1 hypothetical protein Amac_096010 [Acrocarpospora macrocephala]